MGVDDKLYDAQSQAHTTAAAREALVHLVEPLEDSPGGLVRQADPVVLDLEADVRVLGVGPQDDVLVTLRVLVGIVK